ncbi:hypothetical protein BLNAU_18522 [Blattamonas nauphoetae]|uniref:Uncharacterized protein n=1 Tax=Blattamonas nauphoetae TaxID=2049346 RepID=A0ABQ9X434_9EUKA|nr:hypothetical protein BLNAU_18522 [Blattamonas nauphoetae]
MSALNTNPDAPSDSPCPEKANIHICLTRIIIDSFWLATPNCLQQLEIEDPPDQQAVHETVLTQVIIPSEQYIRHLCVNRYSIIDGDLSDDFINFLAQFLRISPSYQPTLEFVLNRPIIPTIPSCLAFIEQDESIWELLEDMLGTQREWNTTRGEERQMWKTVHRMLRMEGIEDVIEEKLQNDRNGYFGEYPVAFSITLNNLQGMNLPFLW